MLFLAGTSFAQDRTYNFILSSSPNGKYVIAMDSNSGEKALVNLEGSQLLNTFSKRYSFWNWLVGDQVVFSFDSEDSVHLGIYDVETHSSKMLKSVQKSVFKLIVKDADYVAVPNYTSTPDSSFVVFLQGDEIGKYYLLHDRTEVLFKVPSVLKDMFINNVTVNNTGTKILITCKDGGVGYLYQINAGSGSYKVLEKSKGLSFEDCYVYATKNDDIYVVYRHILSDEASNRIQISLMNLKTGESKILASLEDAYPMSIVHLPEQKKFLLNIMEPKGESIPLSKQLLRDLVNSISASLSYLELSY